MKNNRHLAHAFASFIFALLVAARAFSQSTVDGFDPQPNGPVFAITLQTDGRILVGGTFTSVGGLPRTNLARLNVDGSVDATFTPAVSVVHPFVDPTVMCFVEQKDGKILVGGFFTTLGGQSRSNLARLNADGSVDPTFNPGADSFVLSLAEQADGKIIVGGYFRSLAGQPRRRIGRLHADGTLDASFEAETDDSPNSTVDALLLQRDGKILVAGQFTELGGQPRNH